MRICGVSPEDYKLVEAMHSGTYILPKRPLDQLLVKESGRIYSYGSIQPLVEATLVTNPNISDRKKLESTKHLLYALGETCKRNHFPSVHIYTENEGFSNWLQERHGFQKIKGQALVLEF